ncbi:class I adenylate-forming enzyme family protein [Tomitella cavernea]|uniref:Class I adenylate-forming enzyme family protein n=1 Tax=Tomitella cavernea TaxID=1387982 RepID=A0ABP9CRE8_9ACTN|nr:AMP-binding protein [Tomitella cavernea]
MDTTARATGDMVVGSMLATAARTYRDREMIYCATTGRRFTFGEVDTRVNRLAHGLMGLGLAKGDTVAYLFNNRAEIVEVFFALAKAGLVGVPLNYRLAAPEVVDLVRSCEAKALICAEGYVDVAAEVHAADTPLRHVVAAAEGAVPDFAARYEDIVAAGSDAAPDVDVRETDTQYFNLTSGTTGLPKAYRLNHYNNAFAALTMPLEFDVTRADTILTAFPMYGRVGAAWLMIGTCMGVRNVITDYEPQRIAEHIEAERCTITNFVPTMAAMLLQLPNITDFDFGSLRAIVFAGSPLPAPVRERTLATLCPNLYEFYGMQETGLVAAIGAADKSERPDSVGQASIFSDIRVVDDEGGRVPAGESGEIIVRSPASTTGYFRNEEKTSETFRDGWIHTGDIGRFDSDGFLYVTGRKKDVIVTGGQNVFSVEVEAVLLQHPDVADCAVIGTADPVWGEAVTAVVVPRGGTAVDEAALIDHCKRTLAGFKAPKRIIRRGEAIPRTPTGKITKYVLEEQYRVVV